MKTRIKIKVRRLGDLARGHVALDQLRIQNRSVILSVAENILVLQEEIDKQVLAEERVKKEVVDDHGSPIVTQKPQVKLTPEAEIRGKLIEIANQDLEIELHTIEAPVLFSGEAAPTPTVLAALMPILRDLDKVPNV